MQLPDLRDMSIAEESAALDRWLNQAIDRMRDALGTPGDGVADWPIDVTLVGELAGTGRGKQC